MQSSVDPKLPTRARGQTSHSAANHAIDCRGKKEHILGISKEKKFSRKTRETQQTLGGLVYGLVMYGWRSFRFCWGGSKAVVVVLYALTVYHGPTPACLLWPSQGAPGGHLMYCAHLAKYLGQSTISVPPWLPLRLALVAQVRTFLFVNAYIAGSQNVSCVSFPVIFVPAS